MLVLLPPSETKALGGFGPPLDLDALSFPALTPVRRKLVDALVDLAADPAASMAALGLSERQLDEVRHNAELHSAPTMLALTRYTGVLYDALGIGTLTKAERARADARLAVASALFGLARGTDRVPHYRLSAGSSLAAVGPLRGVWKPVLEPTLSEVDGLVVDLRSGSYAGLARVPGAVTVRVVTDDGTGRRKTVSHFNKAHKGRLARVLGSARKEASTVKDVIKIAGAAGLSLEVTGDTELELLTD
ncbi:peroxide stress protein YaaA [Allokutzneria sp. A3M-2-11 16]|uniref:peroxide stress protein YaaA n=1 Tax=Allokutzneria sp. A3M-2-11 16 TaxID=2962043 RepID=UPI0020B784B9|nr:peroxide stress protein YaaA [Allokutzneria sp. A3M-2-11 16]MCP3797866.1 peroxide stress protein YaaA [Allokutzneria sp. A3M-2-11 16]